MIVQNPKWWNREQTAILCYVDWQDDLSLPHVKGLNPFVASQDDIYEYGRDLFERIKSGEFGRIAEYEVQP